MAEIEFADGTRVVDDAYVQPIHEVTNGAPERFPFQQVMDRMARFFERQILKNAQSDAIREHFRTWG